MTNPHRCECAWCGQLLRHGIEPVSHGICEPCAATWMAEQDADDRAEAEGRAYKPGPNHRLAF